MMEPPAHKAFKVTQEPQGLQDQVVVQLDPQVIPVHKVRRVHRVLRAYKVIRVFKVLLVQMALKAAELLATVGATDLLEDALRAEASDAAQETFFHSVL